MSFVFALYLIGDKKGQSGKRARLPRVPLLLLDTPQLSEQDNIIWVLAKGKDVVHKDKGKSL